MIFSVQLLLMSAGMMFASPAGVVSVVPDVSVETLLRESPSARVVTNPMTGLPHVITGLKFKSDSAEPVAIADAFVARYAGLFGRPTLRRHTVQKSSNTIGVHYTQTIEGRPVFERSLVINVSPSGFVKSVNN